MDNIKHIKTIFSKNDTSMTLLSSVVVFVLPIVIFSFCYGMQNTADAYAIKNVKTLERDLCVVSVRTPSMNLAVFNLD